MYVATNAKIEGCFVKFAEEACQFTEQHHRNELGRCRNILSRLVSGNSRGARYESGAHTEKGKEVCCQGNEAVPPPARVGTTVCDTVFHGWCTGMW